RTPTRSEPTDDHLDGTQKHPPGTLCADRVRRLPSGEQHPTRFRTTISSGAAERPWKRKQPRPTRPFVSFVEEFTRSKSFHLVDQTGSEPCLLRGMAKSRRNVVFKNRVHGSPCES